MVTSLQKSESMFIWQFNVSSLAYEWNPMACLAIHQPIKNRLTNIQRP